MKRIILLTILLSLSFNLYAEERNKGVSSFFTKNISYNFISKLNHLCPSIKFFPLECFKKHFSEILFDQLNYKDNILEQFYKYKQLSDDDTFINYLDTLIMMSQKEAIDLGISQNEVTSLMQHLTDVEYTFNIFDKDKNNILDNQELIEVFKVYREAIIKIVDLESDNEKYARPIFMYIIHYQKVPTHFQLINFIYNPFGISQDEITAERLNIATFYFFMRKKQL